ncbi:phosphoesterase PA-phosphatase related protein [Gemmatirosa kalamazoonensis]|uniref:Phosphoesterase PA-phosphatase related protein n=1 Tax=Gemmatirosa kalamazoonensis TaxID=861299 RepID=W0REW9_9BACT|nr:phosphatase PAP2 family protein [Gemmatirosa kalamazoonensis]AHG88875.1 phosphoesterase PA-phosphatase related protein [Gemmatirosa kalamazoonensis]
MRSGAETRRRAAAAILLGTVWLALSCDRTVTLTEVLPTLRPANVDADAGTWRMLVLNGPDQVAVAAPAAATSDAYRTEVEAVKAAQSHLTAAQRAGIDYWAGGGVLRWNQIQRELVARYNLPPAPRDDGTYPAPDAENPFGDPAFPFANPPYAARAYSYVAVAQYEALKAAWYWKYRYNRPSPAKADASVRALLPATDLPAYPSEDAVLSGVTAEMLKLLFPAALEEITKKAAEEREAAIDAGRATASDVAAGLALGKAIAALVVARAGADGTRNAVGTPAQWKALFDSTTAKGEVAWVSQEAPARPPMLPNFGQVRTWVASPAVLAAIAPPPSTSSAKFKADLAEVKDVVTHLTSAQLAIAQKWNDGAGTYTPPGHWNAIATSYVAKANMSEVRAARTFALLNVAMHDAGVACWQTKYRYFNPRPTQMDPAIKTVIGLPNFPAYPSGHSTFSAAAATVLGYVFPEGASSFLQMADEAGISRLYGGIHYRSDIDNGKVHGMNVGADVVTFARGDGAR